ncbi:MAG: ComEA family DNA-binding protein [Armatimonadota bacterium]|nr:ComEA family DNA-binding protein [Armatimonadota bacterium]MDR7450467.1 ComEA family DNA-binding protein [Armatimonadota bacterium]MDR7466950.1 ComEA family DNA-binding protein [Armatimonadota bacterium]MDR7493508.1 ComEA family DNA-binding protein [Armatimonadota bacterium]MDR7498773.1 ComEA family DNA-binding protein [Armatimonadota bacterium]
MRWTRAEQLLVLVSSGAVIAGIAVLVFVQRPAPAVRIFEAPPAAEVVVQVDGAVVRPGLYRLPAGSRTEDAVRAAGGLSPAADSEGINRARLLRDGERVTVPYRGAGSSLLTAGAPRDGAASALPPVDLNRASAAELEGLPGIGPVLARRIIAHRDRNGRFHRLEDLLEVQGIGPKLLARLRQRVVLR